MTSAFVSGHLALDFAGTMGRWRTCSPSPRT
ncbi:hypothetical protein FHX82_005104 [Amycolatopsis bartoniae]|nr:hypothetical protein [Amycolatopsis bartoniae]